MRRKLSLCLVLLGAVCLAACGTGRPAPPSDTLVIGKLADIENWNPYLADSSFAEDVLGLIYPTLAVEQPDYEQHPPSFRPWLASSWDISQDGLAITFHLDPRARWQDGVPVTAEDVLYTWKVQHSEAVGWPGAEDKDRIAGVEAVDDHTVVFRFVRPNPYQIMDANEGPIVPAHAWRKIPFDDWEQTDWRHHTLGAGPFKFDHHKPQQEIVLVKNPNYWIPGRPEASRVVWRIVPDQTALLTQLLAGSLDFLEAVPPREAGRVDNDPHLKLITFPDRAYTYIGWNLERPQFSDRRVRTALSLAIDREALVKTARAGYGRLGTGPVLSTMWAFDHTLKPLPYDPAEARRLLAKAGWHDTDGDGVLDRNGEAFTFQLMTNSGNQTREDVMVMVQQDLAKVGITVQTFRTEWGVMNRMLDAGEYDAYVNAWRESTQVDLGSIWHSAPPGEPTYNWGRYANPEVDRLIEEVERASDFDDQLPLLHRIQQLIVRDQPYTFLYESDRVTALSERVHGADINAATPYFNLDQWRVEPAGGR